MALWAMSRSCSRRLIPTKIAQPRQRASSAVHIVLAHDASQQRTMQRVLDALAERTAIDELGLGTLRDQISAVLHPGMSVLHTRARYLLFVPWAFQGGSGMTSESLTASVRNAELRTMRSLVRRYGQ